MIQVALDLPAAGQVSDPLSIRLEGWIFVGERHRDLTGVEFVAPNGVVVGRSSLLYSRPDVAAALKLAQPADTGFSILGAAPDFVAALKLQLTVVACFRDGSRESAASFDLTLTGRDYRAGDWGVFVDPAFPHLVRREHMYNSGPSLDAPSGVLLQHLRRYLPPPPARVLDVGCGRGPYAEPLRALGYDWLGVEVKSEDCAELQRKGLPHRQVDGTGLPFVDGEFDAGICIEVLEHVDNPWAFIAEVRRVVRQRLVVSVPNLEAVTYWRPHLAVPWHLLESDHKNFFSRASLRELLGTRFRSVEVLSYGDAGLRTIEGASVDYHLLAIATV